MDQLLASPGFPGPASSLDVAANDSRDGHETERFSVSMTKRSWQRSALAATREMRGTDDFRQCAENVLRSNAIAVRIRCTASTANICTGETCRASLTRETSASPEDGIGRGDIRGELRTAEHPGRPFAGCGATPSDRSRRNHRRDVSDARRRARAATAVRRRLFSNRVGRGSASPSRHETSSVAPARVPALRLAPARGSLRKLSALRQTTGDGGCT